MRSVSATELVQMEIFCQVSKRKLQKGNTISVIRSPDAEKGGETSVRLWSPPPTDPVRSPRERAKRAWSTRTASRPAERFGHCGARRSDASRA